VIYVTKNKNKRILRQYNMYYKEHKRKLHAADKGHSDDRNTIRSDCVMISPAPDKIRRTAQSRHAPLSSDYLEQLE